MSKQYLLMCNEQVMHYLSGMIRGIEFIEVQGINLNNENKFNLLATPFVSPVLNQTVLPPTPPKDAVMESIEDV